MNLVKSVVAAAIVLASLTAANAQSRETIETGIHGNTPGAAQSTRSDTRNSERDWRAAHAREHNIAGHVHVQPGDSANPLLDDIHGGPAR